MKKTAALFLVFIIIFQGFSPFSYAATESNPYFDAYSSSIGNPSGNTLQIDFNIITTDYMDYLGASTAILYKDGSPLKTYSRYNPLYTSSMVTTNTDVFYGHLSYSNAPAGTYYAEVTFFATNGTGSGSAIFTTSTITIP